MKYFFRIFDPYANNAGYKYVRSLVDQQEQYITWGSFDEAKIFNAKDVAGMECYVDYLANEVTISLKGELVDDCEVTNHLAKPAPEDISRQMEAAGDTGQKPTDDIIGFESDPNGINQHEAGAKLDEGKIFANVLFDFSLALTEVAKVGTFGAKKYSRGGWQSVPNAIERYNDASVRHQLKEARTALDSDSGLLHKAQRIWNELAALELQLRAEENNP